MGSVQCKTSEIKLSNVNEILSDTREINSMLQGIEKQGSQLALVLSDAIKKKRDLQSIVQSVVSMQTVAKEDISKFLNNAKELGIDASNQKEIKELQSVMSKIKDTQAWFNSIGTIPQI